MVSVIIAVSGQHSRVCEVHAHSQSPSTHGTACKYTSRVQPLNKIANANIRLGFFNIFELLIQVTFLLKYNVFKQKSMFLS